MPDYVWNVLNEMPKNTHPMTMFNTGILAMQGESIFKKRYNEGMKKSEYWEAVLDDGVRLIAKLPSLGAEFIGCVLKREIVSHQIQILIGLGILLK